MKALIVVDAQFDFMAPGLGSLPVPGAMDAQPYIARLMRQFAHAKDLIIATRDWHPGTHSSFIANGGTWPAHCMQHHYGAMLDKSVFQYADYVVSKGMFAEHEEYSAWYHISSMTSSWDEYISEVTICGFALDVCVYATAMDALTSGVKVTIDTDASAGIDNDKISARLAELERRGAQMVGSGVLA